VGRAVATSKLTTIKTQKKNGADNWRHTIFL